MRREQDVVVRALDDVDGVDLHITQVLDSATGGVGAAAEGLARVEPLGAQPEPAGLDEG